MAHVGQQVTLDDGRVGYVKFIGNTSFASGVWVGVELEGPVGKNNGSISGVEYFTCKPSHGAFVRRTSIKLMHDVSKAKKHKLDDDEPPEKAQANVQVEVDSDDVKTHAKTKTKVKAQKKVKDDSDAEGLLATIYSKIKTKDDFDEVDLPAKSASTKAKKKAKLDSDDESPAKAPLVKGSTKMMGENDSDQAKPKPKVSMRRSSSVRRMTSTKATLGNSSTVGTLTSIPQTDALEASKGRSSSVLRKSSKLVAAGNASLVVNTPGSKVAAKKKYSLQEPALVEKKSSLAEDFSVAKPMKKSSSVSASKKKPSKVSASESEVVPPPPKPPSGRPCKLFTAEENIGDKLVGVVVTISGGSTYDPMFKEVKPTTVPGERVSTYSVSLSSVWALHMYLQDFPSILVSLPFPCQATLCQYLEDEGLWFSLVQDIGQVPPDSVVFNWECCSDCGDRAFPCPYAHAKRNLTNRKSRRQKSQVGDSMKFMGFAVHRGWTVMCSDFSLKSLLHEWSEDLKLGPNPFSKIGTCSGQCSLEFVPEQLQNEDVPQQLQVVGELCKEQGKAVIKCLGSTIVYTVNPNRKATELYDLKVLTVVTDFQKDSETPKPQDQPDKVCSLGEGEMLRSGFAGHVTLTYKSGGQMITSMGHWIELSNIDTSVESVMRAAYNNFGDEEVENFRKEFSCQRSDASRNECVQKYAKNMVSKSAPSRMKARTKYACKGEES